MRNAECGVKDRRKDGKVRSLKDGSWDDEKVRGLKDGSWDDEKVRSFKDRS
jgi:hypothetical protein